MSLTNSPVGTPLPGWSVAALLVALAAVAWLLSWAPLSSDDLLFMARAMSTRGDPLIVFDRMVWFHHQRPLFYGSFWLLGPLDLGGGGVRLLQVLLWGGMVAGLSAWAHARQGRAGVWLVALGLVCFPPFLDMLGWRSWLTSTGTASGLALGLWALWSGRPGLVLLAGLWAAGFKETGPMVLGLAALFVPGAGRSSRLVGLALVGLSVGLGSVITYKVDLATVPDSAVNTLHVLGPLAWMSALLLARYRPGISGWWLACAALLPLLPSPLPGLITVGVAMAVSPRLAPALAVAWGLATIGLSWHEVYAVEGAVLLIAVWIVGPPIRLRARVWAVISVLALAYAYPTLPAWRAGVERALHQRMFLEQFHPQPALELYFTSRPVYELDVLVWLSQGARLAGHPPPGTWPVQIGPISGVWADATTAGHGLDPQHPPPRWEPPPGEHVFWW